MNTIIQSQLDRVETSLNSLIDSIASYNPSIPAASALLAADEELNKGLKELAIHQANHARILQLRETINRQNETITSTLTQLVSTRTDLLSVPTSLPKAHEAHNVPYTDLLDYAKRISRYTVPPTFRPPVAAPPTAANGTEGTPKTVEGGGAEDREKQGIGYESLEDVERRWLDPLRQIPFVPWPSEEVIKSGALAEIQGMMERGIDPESVDAGGVKDDEKVREVIMERREEGANAGRPSDTVQGRGVPKQTPRQEKPKVFGGLDLYDPDEEG
ncbi:hypothetical protein MMC28_003641 [Mycoblastus sanguinarius]|nr:hypothetical protein [Mycoblastus sanguinarius]